MKNCDFSIFWGAFVNDLWLTKKKGGQNGDFCSGISRLHERLGEPGEPPASRIPLYYLVLFALQLKRNHATYRGRYYFLGAYILRAAVFFCGTQAHGSGLFYVPNGASPKIFEAVRTAKRQNVCA